MATSTSKTREARAALTTSSVAGERQQDRRLPRSWVRKGSASRQLDPVDAEAGQVLPETVGVIDAPLPGPGGREQRSPRLRERSGPLADPEHLGKLHPVERVQRLR